MMKKIFICTYYLSHYLTKLRINVSRCTSKKIVKLQSLQIPLAIQFKLTSVPSNVLAVRS